MKIFRKPISLFLATLFVLSVLAAIPFTASATVPAEETRNGVTAYYIDSADELIALLTDIGSTSDGNYATYYGKTLMLTNDLDMTGKTCPQGITFRGTLDGQGHAIKNLNLTTSGLFANTGNSTFKNLAIVNCTVTAAHPAVIARDITSGLAVTFENVYIEANMTAASGSMYAGGFIGRSAGTADQATFTNCVSNCVITGSASAGVGGFLGWTNVNNKITMNNCAFIGDLSGVTAARGVGGFVGGARCYVTLNRCISMGKGSTQELYGAFLTLANPTMQQSFVAADCYVGQKDVKAVSAETADTFHTVSIQQGASEVYALPTGTALSEKLSEMDHQVARFAEGTAVNLTETEWDQAESDYAVLKNAGWVMTDATVVYDEGTSLPQLLPATIAVMVSSPITLSYWQVKEGETNDFRFVGTINIDALYAYDTVGYEVTVQRKDGDTLIDAQQVSTNIAYTSITADGVTKTAAELNAEYLVALSINGFQNTGVIYEVTITPFVTCEGIVIRDYDGTVTAIISGNTLTQA